MDIHHHSWLFMVILVTVILIYVQLESHHSSKENGHEVERLHDKVRRLKSELGNKHEGKLLSKRLT